MPLVPILVRIVQGILRRGAERTVIARFDDVRGAVDRLISDGDLPTDFEDRSEEEQRQLIEKVPEEKLQRAIMVNFNTFMSIGLTKCGSDQATFQGLTQLWNRQKDEISSMTRSELEDKLRCP